MSSGPARQQVSRRQLAGAVLWLSAIVIIPAPSISQVAAKGRALELLMFEEPGCPWCRRWQADVGVGYPLSAEGKRAPLRIVQLHDSLPAEIRFTRPVLVSPTFVLVADGREVGRITGYPGAEFFWPMLGDLLRKSESASPLPADLPMRAT